MTLQQIRFMFSHSQIRWCLCGKIIKARIKITTDVHRQDSETHIENWSLHQRGIKCLHLWRSVIFQVHQVTCSCQGVFSHFVLHNFFKSFDLKGLYIIFALLNENLSLFYCQRFEPKSSINHLYQWKNSLDDSSCHHKTVEGIDWLWFFDKFNTYDMWIIHKFIIESSALTKYNCNDAPKTASNLCKSSKEFIAYIWLTWSN